jgi:hypothetical protein
MPESDHFCQFMNMKSILVCFVICVVLEMQVGAATSNVNGVVVDAVGNPIAGVRCTVSGFPQPSGGRTLYTGLQTFVFTDKDGHFSIALPRNDPLVDLQFDGGEFAPLFIYKVKPADSPLQVVMSEGKLLRGRVIDRVDDKLVPIPHAEIELQMPQEDFWYQNRQATDAKGEFRFRISEPPGAAPWMLYYAGKRITIDYAQVKPETVMVIEVSLKLTSSTEPSGVTNADSPRRD